MARLGVTLSIRGTSKGRGRTGVDPLRRLRPAEGPTFGVVRTPATPAEVRGGFRERGPDAISAGEALVFSNRRG